MLMPVDCFFAGCPVFLLASPRMERMVRNGSPIPAPGLEPGQYRLSYEAGTTFETEGTASGKFTVAAPELCALPLAPGAQD